MNRDIATYPKRTNWYGGTFTRKTVALSAATHLGQFEQSVRAGGHIIRHQNEERARLSGLNHRLHCDRIVRGSQRLHSPPAEQLVNCYLAYSLFSSRRWENLVIVGFNCVGYIYDCPVSPII